MTNTAAHGHERSRRGRPHRGRSPHTLENPGGRARVRPSRTAAPHRARRPALHLGHRTQPVPHVLRRRGPQHDAELEGVLLRLFRPRELHHPRQDPGVPVAAGALRPPPRFPSVDPDPAPGPRRRGEPAGAVPSGAPLGRDPRGPRRRRGLPGDPGRGRSVPHLRRGPGLHPLPAARRRGHPARRPRRPAEPAAAGRLLGRRCLPGQDAGGLGRAARARPGPPGLGPGGAAPPARPPRPGRPGDARRVGFLDARRHPRTGEGAAVRGRHHRQLRVQHGRRLQLPEPLRLAGRQRGRHRERERDPGVRAPGRRRAGDRGAGRRGPGRHRALRHTARRRCDGRGRARPPRPPDRGAAGRGGPRGRHVPGRGRLRRRPRRLGEDVRPRARRPDRLVLPVRRRGRRLRSALAPGAAAHRRRAGRLPAVGHLARHVLPGLQRRQRRPAHLLHGRDRGAARRAHRRRDGAAVARPPGRRAPRVGPAGRGRGGDGLERVPGRPVPLLPAVAGARGGGARVGRRRPAGPHPAGPPARRRPARARRARRLPRGPARRPDRMGGAGLRPRLRHRRHGLGRSDRPGPGPRAHRHPRRPGGPRPYDRRRARRLGRHRLGRRHERGPAPAARLHPGPPGLRPLCVRHHQLERGVPVHPRGRRRGASARWVQRPGALPDTRAVPAAGGRRPGPLRPGGRRRGVRPAGGRHGEPGGREDRGDADHRLGRVLLRRGSGRGLRWHGRRPRPDALPLRPRPVA
ncbi:hypothetical protein SGPA1_40796 [Streptomyces misionensis JCM 4497]